MSDVVVANESSDGQEIEAAADPCVDPQGSRPQPVVVRNTDECPAKVEVVKPIQFPEGTVINAAPPQHPYIVLDQSTPRNVLFNFTAAIPLRVTDSLTIKESSSGGVSTLRVFEVMKVYYHVGAGIVEVAPKGNLIVNRTFES